MRFITSVALSGLLATAALAVTQVEVGPDFLEGCLASCDADDDDCQDFCEDVDFAGFQYARDFAHPKCYDECPENDDPDFVGCYQDCLRDLFGSQFQLVDDDAEDLAEETQEKCSAECDTSDPSFETCIQECAIEALGLGLDEDGDLMGVRDVDDAEGNIKAYINLLACCFVSNVSSLVC